MESDRSTWARLPPGSSAQNLGGRCTSEYLDLKETIRRGSSVEYIAMQSRRRRGLKRRQRERELTMRYLGIQNIIGLVDLLLVAKAHHVLTLLGGSVEG